MSIDAKRIMPWLTNYVKTKTEKGNLDEGLK